MQWNILCCNKWHPLPYKNAYLSLLSTQRVKNSSLDRTCSFYRANISWEDSYLAVFSKVTQKKPDRKVNYAFSSPGTHVVQGIILPLYMAIKPPLQWEDGVGTSNVCTWGLGTCSPQVLRRFGKAERVQRNKMFRHCMVLTTGNNIPRIWGVESSVYNAYLTTKI